MGSSKSRFFCDKFETCYEDGVEYQSVDQCRRCDKAKHHEHYINAPEFTIDHLPEQFRTERIFRLVKLLSDLTVKIIVKYISENRKKPENLQYQKVKFPLADNAGQQFQFNGSGRIWDIFPRNEKYKNLICPCPKCIERPAENVWIVKVYTATHVVFDTDEAKQAVCILFHDTSPGPRHKLYGLEATWTHTEGDLCILYCVTCDENLAELIKIKNQELSVPWQELETGDNRDNEHEKLAVIVSHPHGCPKQISVGRWESRVPVNEDVRNEHRYTYNKTISTCPGSSGGPVYILGSSFLYSAYCHSGSNKKENFSSCWLYADEGTRG